MCHGPLAELTSRVTYFLQTSTAAFPLRRPTAVHKQSPELPFNSSFTGLPLRNGEQVRPVQPVSIGGATPMQISFARGTGNRGRATVPRFAGQFSWIVSSSDTPCHGGWVYLIQTTIRIRGSTLQINNGVRPLQRIRESKFDFLSAGTAIHSTTRMDN